MAPAPRAPTRPGPAPLPSGAPRWQPARPRHRAPRRAPRGDHRVRRAERPRVTSGLRAGGGRGRGPPRSRGVLAVPFPSPRHRPGAGGWAVTGSPRGRHRSCGECVWLPEARTGPVLHLLDLQRNKLTQHKKQLYFPNYLEFSWNKNDRWSLGTQHHCDQKEQCCLSQNSKTTKQHTNFLMLKQSLIFLIIPLPSLQRGGIESQAILYRSSICLLTICT